MAKKKSVHTWFDQALCKPNQNFEGTKRQRKDNNLLIFFDTPLNLNTCGLADD